MKIEPSLTPNRPNLPPPRTTQKPTQTPAPAIAHPAIAAPIAAGPIAWIRR